MRQHRLARRRLLQGLGASLITLPAFETFAPKIARAQDAANRLVMLFFPNGTHGSDQGTDLYPTGSGSTYTLSPRWSALERHRADISILKNIKNAPADAGEDPNHPKACSCWLTCTPITKSYTEIHAGISMDQVVAGAVGGQSDFPSLVLANGGPVSAPNEGYAPIYYQNISWLSETTPASRIEDPVLLFDRLFGSPVSGENDARRSMKQSVLDFAVAETTRLSAGLGSTDRARLDQYLTGIRDVERVLSTGGFMTGATCTLPERPAAPVDFKAQLSVMSQLVVLALQCDRTRVVTFMLDVARSNRNAEFAGVTGAHHDISHHAGNPDMIEKLLTINGFYADRFAEFLDAMKAADVVGGKLLDQSMVLWGAGLGDADGHRKDHLPLVVAGGGGGKLHPGSVHDLPPNTPLANVHLTLMQHMGVQAQTFGDSSGTLQI